MKKYMLDLVVTQNTRLHANYVLIKMTHANPLPDMVPGQFAEIRIDGSTTTFLRRPISINFVDKEANEVWFLVQLVGDGTRKLATVKEGDVVNVVLPLGNGYTLPQDVTAVKPLLVGGGVGTAPMLMLGATLAKMGCKPTFLLGARSSKDLLQLDEFSPESYIAAIDEAIVSAFVFSKLPLPSWFIALNTGTIPLDRSEYMKGAFTLCAETSPTYP